MKCGSFYNGRKSFLGNDTKSLLDIVPFTVSLNSCRLLEQRRVSGTVSSHGSGRRSSRAGRKDGVFAHGRPSDRQALLPRHAVIRVVLLRNGGRDMSAHEGPYEEAQRSCGSDALHDQPPGAGLGTVRGCRRPCWDGSRGRGRGRARPLGRAAPPTPGLAKRGPREEAAGLHSGS